MGHAAAAAVGRKSFLASLMLKAQLAGISEAAGSTGHEPPDRRACQDLDAMGFYQDQVVPLLTSLSMRNKNLAAYRKRVVPEATGRVLEVGIGSGLNLPLYSPDVQQVIGPDPSPKLLKMAGRIERRGLPVDFVEGSAEEVPLQKASVDLGPCARFLTLTAHCAKCVACLNRPGVCCSSNTVAPLIRRWCGGKIGLRRFGNLSAAAAISIGRLAS